MLVKRIILHQEEVPFPDYFRIRGELLKGGIVVHTIPEQLFYTYAGDTILVELGIEADRLLLELNGIGYGYPLQYLRIMGEDRQIAMVRLRSIPVEDETGWLKYDVNITSRLGLILLGLLGTVLLVTKRKR